MIFGSAALLLACVFTPQSTDSAGVLLEAGVRIVLYPTYARVVGVYDIDRNGTELRFDARRAPEQLVLIGQVSGQGLDSTPQQRLELRRLVARAGPSGESAYRIVYSVSGDLSRLPLFVPNARTDPDRTELQIQLVAAHAGAEVSGGDLEFQSVGEGLLVAHPGTLPQFVSLGEDAEGSRRTRRIGWLVALILLGVASAIVYRATRSDRRGRRGADGDASGADAPEAGR